MSNIDRLVEEALKEKYEKRVEWYTQMKKILKQTGLVNDIVGEILPYFGVDPALQPFSFDKESHLGDSELISFSYDKESRSWDPEVMSAGNYCGGNFMEIYLPGAKIIYDEQLCKEREKFLYSGLMLTGYKDYIIVSLYLSVPSSYYPMGTDAWKYIFDKCSGIYRYKDIRHVANVTSTTIKGINIETILDSKKLNKIRDTPAGHRISNFLRTWNTFDINVPTLKKNLDEYHRQKELIFDGS